MCQKCSHDNVTRRGMLTKLVRGLAAVAAALATGLAAKGAQPGQPGESRPLPGYGRCLCCSCPGYSGQGQTCRRCYHHWSQHQY